MVTGGSVEKPVNRQEFVALPAFESFNEGVLRRVIGRDMMPGTVLEAAIRRSAPATSIAQDQKLPQSRQQVAHSS
jgi:hypothetical protein